MDHTKGADVLYHGQLNVMKDARLSVQVFRRNPYHNYNDIITIRNTVMAQPKTS